MSDQSPIERPIALPRPVRAAPRRQRAIPRTPLALAVMNLLHERSMHPYEMKVLMLQRGHERAVRLKEASLYDTVERLAAVGFIAPVEVTREGRRPERTVYGITQAGRDDLLIWMQQLISEPSPEYPNFAAASPAALNVSLNVLEFSLAEVLRSPNAAVASIMLRMNGS